MNFNMFYSIIRIILYILYFDNIYSFNVFFLFDCYLLKIILIRLHIYIHSKGLTHGRIFPWTEILSDVKLFIIFSKIILIILLLWQILNTYCIEQNLKKLYIIIMLRKPKNGYIRTNKDEYICIFIIYFIKSIIHVHVYFAYKFWSFFSIFSLPTPSYYLRILMSI